MTGQFTNTTALLTLFASAAIGVGVIKYLAEYGGDKVAQFRVIRTAFWLIFIASFLTGIITIIFARFFSVSAFKTDEYQAVYILWGSFLVISALSSFLNSVLNGLKLIRYLTIINISTTIIGLIITVILARYFGVFGVLIASNFTVLALFIMHLFFIQRYKWFQFRDFLQGIDFKILKLLSSFILMSLVSGILVPSIQLVVRNKIISDFSFKDAGYWQSVTRISDYYLGFIISVLSIYYLPRLSEIKDKQELKKEIFNS